MSLNPDRELSCSTLRVCGTGTDHFTSIPEQWEQMGIDGTGAGFTLKSLFRGLGTDGRKKGAFTMAENRHLFPKLGTDQNALRGRPGWAWFMLLQSVRVLRICSPALAHQKSSPLNEIRNVIVLTSRLSCGSGMGLKLQPIENKGLIK